MGRPTQRATNYTARSNIDTAQIFLHANGQRPKRAPIRQRSRRRQRRGEPHTEHGLGVLPPTHQPAPLTGHAPPELGELPIDYRIVPGSFPNPVMSVGVCYTAVDAAAGGLTTGWWAVVLECFSSHLLLPPVVQRAWKRVMQQ